MCLGTNYSQSIAGLLLILRLSELLFLQLSSTVQLFLSTTFRIKQFSTIGRDRMKQGQGVSGRKKIIPA
jgi:hypothetical protein